MIKELRTTGVGLTKEIVPLPSSEMGKSGGMTGLGEKRNPDLSLGRLNVKWDKTNGNEDSCISETLREDKVIAINAMKNDEMHGIIRELGVIHLADRLGDGKEDY